MYQQDTWCSTGNETFGSQFLFFFFFSYILSTNPLLLGMKNLNHISLSCSSILHAFQFLLGIEHLDIISLSFSSILCTSHLPGLNHLDIILIYSIYISSFEKETSQSLCLFFFLGRSAQLASPILCLLSFNSIPFSFSNILCTFPLPF